MQGQNRQWLCPCSHERQYGHKDGHGSWSGHLHSPADAQQTSHDVGAAVSQLHHAAGSQGTNGFLGFAVLTAQMKATYSSAERQPAPRMGEWGETQLGMWSPSHSIQLFTHCTEVLDFHATPHARLLPYFKGNEIDPRGQNVSPRHKP